MPDARIARPLLLGHRGARGCIEIPENTIISFDQALVHGCDGFEFDVRLTADAVPVICHDPRFRRRQIARFRFADLAPLPQLSEVLVRYGERAFLDIEIKVAGLESIAVDLLRKYPPRCGFVVSSFLPKVLRAVYAADAAIPLGLICETKSRLAQWRKLPVSFVIPHRRLATQRLIRELHEAKKKILVWTVNNQRDMRRLRDLGVDGIISDETRRLCRTLATRPGACR
jgi:glycerophosphoryl diester phosphodiesterase